ncbi:MAG: hypothetical protein AAFY84_14280 [Pseudomonadota bacterium]
MRKRCKSLFLLILFASLGISKGHAQTRQLAEIPIKTFAKALDVYFSECRVSLDALRVSDGFKYKDGGAYVQCPTSFTPLRTQRFPISSEQLSYDWNSLPPDDPRGVKIKTRRYAPNDVRSETISVIAHTADWMKSKGKLDKEFCENCLHFEVIVTFPQKSTIKGFYPWPEGRPKDAPWDVEIENMKVKAFVSMKSTRVKRENGSRRSYGRSLRMRVTDVDLSGYAIARGGHGGNSGVARKWVDELAKKQIYPMVEKRLKSTLNSRAVGDALTSSIRDQLQNGPDTMTVLQTAFGSIETVAFSSIRFDESRDKLLILTTQ